MIDASIRIRAFRRRLIQLIAHALVGSWLCADVCPHLAAADWRTDLDDLIEASCIHCHDANTETRLDFTQLGDDLDDGEVFRQWEHIFDRIDRGEMPPESEPTLNQVVRSHALNQLNTELHRVSLERQQTMGRVPSRRLSRQEYEYTLHDLLGISGKLAKHLPPENASGAFDVIAENQEMSRVHIRGLLQAAELALNEAIQIGRRPPMGKRNIDYFASDYIQMWVDRPVRRGGGTVFKDDQDVVTFRGENFVFRSDANGFKPPVVGDYRVNVTAAAHQPRSSITVSLKRQNDKQGESGLLAAWDLAGSEYRELQTEVYLRPDDYIYVSADELEPAPDGGIIYNSQPASEFGGEGVRIRHFSVEGPLESDWPPQRTRQLFPGIDWKATREPQDQGVLSPETYKLILTDQPIDHARATLTAFAPKAFRREVSPNEIEALLELATRRLDQGRGFIESVRVPLRAILVSPHLVFLEGDAGRLDEMALASRLSYFLWRSRPDEELTRVATEGGLSDSATLAHQVDRMLADPKSQRFIHDFLDQWLELDQIDATNPDTYLYPEYDDVLRHAMLAETREFFAHLIAANLSTNNLIDSDFTFLNRRLAEHYGIDGVEGETVRRVQLEPEHIRGGILTHASVAKVTANGTVTTPVKRGNFVLTNLLGLPPNPPPPGVGAIEPDTRGATTIRETLLKHQQVDACAVCHQRIDPPGFALECFDPVGSFRKQYRISKGIKREFNAGLRYPQKAYTLGLPVDSSGVTDRGRAFSDIREYKMLLMESSDQVARHLLSMLIAFSTGAEVEFADREIVEAILDNTKPDQYPLRTMIHQLVDSRIFRNR